MEWRSKACACPAHLLTQSTAMHISWSISRIAKLCAGNFQANRCLENASRYSLVCTLYHDHSRDSAQYAERLPIGKESVIRNVPASTVKAFYQRWYRPEHMAVVVVGDFADPDGIVELVKKHMDPCRAAGAGPAVPIPRCWLHFIAVVLATCRFMSTLTTLETTHAPRMAGRCVQCCVASDCICCSGIARNKGTLAQHRLFMIAWHAHLRVAPADMS